MDTECDVHIMFLLHEGRDIRRRRARFRTHLLDGLLGRRASYLTVYRGFIRALFRYDKVHTSHNVHKEQKSAQHTGLECVAAIICVFTGDQIEMTFTCERDFPLWLLANVIRCQTLNCY